MKLTTMEPRTAMDKVVCEWVQQFEDVHFRTEANYCKDQGTGDEFITVYDPVTDVCITVWRSPAWYGHDVLNLARSILAPQLKTGSLPDGKTKGGAR